MSHHTWPAVLCSLYSKLSNQEARVPNFVLLSKKKMFCLSCVLCISIQLFRINLPTSGVSTGTALNREVRGQLMGGDSLRGQLVEGTLSFHHLGSKESISGHWFWQQMPLPTAHPTGPQGFSFPHFSDSTVNATLLDVPVTSINSSLELQKNIVSGCTGSNDRSLRETIARLDSQEESPRRTPRD